MIIMIIQQFISALTLLAITGIASAGVIKVELQVGLIKPGEKILISLDELIPDHVYVLSCVLTSDHNSGKPYNIIQVTTPTNSPKIGLTAEEITSGSHQYNLPTNKNNYLYGDISKDVGDISITNLDKTDSILLSSCHAVGKGPLNT